MKPAVPGEIIDSRGGFKKDNRCARRRARVTSDEPGYMTDFEIIETASKSALDALFEEFS